MDTLMTDKLPKILTRQLSELLSEYGLMSWRLTGNDRIVTVSLRFSLDDNVDIESPVRNVYRKKSPSEVNRDTQRKQKHVEQKLVDKHELENLGTSNHLKKEGMHTAELLSGRMDSTDLACIEKDDITADAVVSTRISNGIKKLNPEHANTLHTNIDVVGPTGDTSNTLELSLEMTTETMNKLTEKLVQLEQMQKVCEEIESRCQALGQEQPP